MTDNNRNNVVVFAGLVSALLILRFVFSFFPESRLWGFNQAAFVPFLIWIYPALLLGIIGYFVIRKRKPALEMSFDGDDSRYKPSPLLLIGVSILSGLWFYLLRVEAHFLGDAYLIIDNPDLPIKTLEYGEAIFHRWLIDIFGSTGAGEIQNIYRSVAIVSGIVFMAVWLLCGAILFRNRSAFLSFAALGFTLPGTLLFYGYIEHYSVTATVLTAAILWGAVSLYRGKKSVGPVILYALAIFFHSASLIYAPAFVVYALLALWPRSERVIGTHAGKLLVLGALMIIIGTVAIREIGPLFWRLALLPVLPDQFTTDGYFLFSISHLLDYINILFLLLPVSILALAYRLIMKRRWNPIRQSPLSAFFILTSAISGLAGAFCIEPKLGMARDWDLISLMLIGGAIAGVVFIVGEFAGSRRRNTVLILAIVAQLAVLAPWLATHRLYDALKEYALSVMKLDPKHSRTGYYSIGNVAASRGETEFVRELGTFVRQSYPEEKLKEEGSAAYRSRQYGTAIDCFRRAIEENPKWYVLYQELGMCQLATGKYRAALRNLRLADALNPYNARTYSCLGTALYETGDTASALKYWHKCLRAGPSLWEPKICLARHYILHGKPDSALLYLQDLAEKTGPPEACYWHGVACLMLADVDCARSQLISYLERGRDDSLLQRVRGILRDLEMPGND